MADCLAPGWLRFPALNHTIGEWLDGVPIILPGKNVSATLRWPSSGKVNRGRDGRVAEGARLESVFRGNSNVGSNPTLSASFLPA